MGLDSGLRTVVDSDLVFERLSEEVLLDDRGSGPQPVGVVLRRLRSLESPEESGSDTFDTLKIFGFGQMTPETFLPSF